MIRKLEVMLLFSCLLIVNTVCAGGWCYRTGECEAWQLKLAVEEANAALCKVGRPGLSLSDVS